MSSETVIKVENLSKCYQIYEHPSDLMPSPSYIREQQARSDAMLSSQSTTTTWLRWCTRQLRNHQRDGAKDCLRSQGAARFALPPARVRSSATNGY